MSMETYVFTKRESIPTAEALQEAIKKAGFNYTLSEGFDTDGEEFNFFMGSFEGLESGCDYVVEAYDANDWAFEDLDRTKVGDADCVIALGTFSNAQEIVAMAIIASVLTELTGGVMLSDFFAEDFINADETVEFAKDVVEGSRDQFNGPSTIRKSVLQHQENGEAFEQKMEDGLSHTDGYDTGSQFADEVRTSLQDAGVSLENSLDLAFYLYLPDQKSAHAALDKIVSIGLKCHIQENEFESDSWLCYSAKTMVPEYNALEKIGETMLELASEHHGNFDGWETVPEFGFNPFAEAADEEECRQMAQQILETTMKMHTPPHVYVEAEHAKFEHFDLDAYAQKQQELEALGYAFLSDLENETASENGPIVTFMRVMHNPETKIAAAFYYFDMFDMFIDEFISFAADGTLFFTSNAMFGNEAAHPENMNVANLAGLATAELIEAHNTRLKALLGDTPLLHAIDTTEKFIDTENEALVRKCEKLTSLGWVTKETIFQNSGGDEALTECVYAALQGILADADA